MVSSWGPCGRYTATPTSVQTARYDPTKAALRAHDRWHEREDCRGRARQHHRRHHRHPQGDKGRERAEPGRNAHVHPVHLPDRDDPGCGATPSVAVSAAAVAAVLVLVMAHGGGAESRRRVRQTHRGPAGHTSHGECGRERGTDGHPVPGRCSWQLLQPGGGEQLIGGSGRRVCPYQIH
jgi:hypothetical protein